MNFQVFNLGLDTRRDLSQLKNTQRVADSAESATRLFHYAFTP